MTARTEVNTPARVSLVPSVDVSVALMCGVVASDRLVWSGIQLLRIWIVWLIVDIVFGLIFAQWRLLKEVDLPEHLEEKSSDSPILFPYTVSGSPGTRFAQTIDGIILQWKDVVWPLAGRAGLTAILGAALALAMATFLGREMLAIVALGLIFGVSLVVICDERETLSRWLRLLQVSLAWILGAGAMGALTLPVMGLALLMGLGAYAREGLDVDAGRGFFRLLCVTNWSFVLLLLLSQQPALGMVIVVASLAETMLRGEHSLRGETSLLYDVSWLVSVFTAALAVTRW